MDTNKLNIMKASQIGLGIVACLLAWSPGSRAEDKQPAARIEVKIVDGDNKLEPNAPLCLFCSYCFVPGRRCLSLGVGNCRKGACIRVPCAGGGRPAFGIEPFGLALRPT